MNGLPPISMVSIVSVVSVAAFFFATAISLNLAVAIYRRAEKSFVVDNLVVILLIIAVESAISLSYGIYGTVRGIDERSRYFLASGAYLAQIAAIAVIVWFILSAPRRMICDSAKFPDAPALRYALRRVVVARDQARRLTKRKPARW